MGGKKGVRLPVSLDRQPGYGLSLSIGQQVNDADRIGFGRAALECGADGLSHRVAVCHCLVMVGRGSAQLVLHTLRGAYGRGGLSHQQNKQQCRDTCGENASRGRVKWRGHNGFRIRLTKSNGWASPIFFVPRTLGRTRSTRHVRVIISVRMVIQGARGGPSRFVGSNGSWHRPKRGERS